jgi:hypothetical protein
VENLLVKLSEEGHSGEGSSDGGGAVGAVVGEEGELLRELSVGKSLEGAEVVSGQLTEVGQGELGGLSRGLDLVAGGGLVSGADFLEDPV